ncbi:phosphoglucomutase [Pseudonocardia sp. ICBG162]|uniref:phosphoglucomutase n=1 Tax=Pseudonocardia sp. ICBG162 TaxID=2846761 RepID=UPI001CF62549|nr:phosphoglucomutase [Pseudonocardia sp. ICBG162]
MTVHERAGTPARPEDLVDVDALLAAYAATHPDPSVDVQRVAFGTSGHRGSAFTATFNDDHIAATSQAIVEYRAAQGTDGPLFLGRDSHALSEPAWLTAAEVFAANGVDVVVDSRDGLTPTPAISHAILVTNAGRDGRHLADGVVVTPSHNPPADGGFKYNPPDGGPAGTEATSWIADRANQLLENGLKEVRRARFDAAAAHRYDYLGTYVDQLDQVLDMAAVRDAGVTIGADPLGGASVDYWGVIAQRWGLDLTVVNPDVDPAFGFMTLDWDGKIRMDCSSPYAMASLRARMEADPAPFTIATGNDADADRSTASSPRRRRPDEPATDYLAVAIPRLPVRPPSRPARGRGGVGHRRNARPAMLIDRVRRSDPALAPPGWSRCPSGFKRLCSATARRSSGTARLRARARRSCARDGSPWSTDGRACCSPLPSSRASAPVRST